MPWISPARRFVDACDTHRRILWALLMRELATRYGRNDIGFLWVVVEPLVFAGAVSLLWSVIKPPYEHGIKVVAFVLTGYLPLIMTRQTVSFAVNAVKSNQALLYHRQITPLHLFSARFTIEFLGLSLAFVVATATCWALGFAPLPLDLPKVYVGWFLLGWVNFGFALIIGSLSELFEVVERFVQISTYILIPLSGAFFMAAWLPPSYRHGTLLLPFIHCFELIRLGFFGPYVVHAYYDIPYVVACAAIMSLIGLLLVQFVRDRIDVE